MVLMSDALTCKGCDKRYVWKAQYAGRKVKCRCGQVLLMPAQDPAGASQAAPQEHQPAAAPPLPAFEMMEETPSPSPQKTKPANQLFEVQDHDTGANVTPAASSGIRVEADNEIDHDAGQAAGQTSGQAAGQTSGITFEGEKNEGTNEDTFELAVDPDVLDTGPKISNSSLAAALSSKPSAVAAALENREDELQLSPWKEKYIPTTIAIVGVLLQIGLWFIFATETKHAVIGAAGMLVVEVLVLMPIAIAAVFLTARIMNIGFGPMIPALLKVAAIAIGTGGVADILFFKMMLSVDFDYQMLLVAFVLHMFLLGLPMLAIFELELSEMVMIVSIIVIPRIVILFGMGWMFPHWF